MSVSGYSGSVRCDFGPNVEAHNLNSHHVVRNQKSQSELLNKIQMISKGLNLSTEREMIRALSLLQLCQITSTKSLLRGATFTQGFYAKSGRIRSPSLCFSRNVQTVTYEIVNASYLPTSQAKQQENKTLDKEPGKLETVGAFQKLPIVMPSVDILYSAMRKAKRVSPTNGITNIAKRERNRGAKQIDALMKELAVPLREYLENFPKKKNLHPYERSLIKLTLGDGNYEEVLRKVDALRKKVVSVGKEHASVCAKSLTKRDAGERLNEGLENLEEIFKSEGKAVDNLLNIAKELKRFPTLQAEIAAAANEALERFREDGKKTVLRLVDMEASYLTVEFFRRLPQEVEKGGRLPQETEKAGNTAASAVDRYSEGHFRRIGSNVSAYIGMVSETLKNTVPKAVVYCQVREAKQSLLNHFYTQIGKKEAKLLSPLLDEDPALMERRQQCAKRLELYKSARDEIDSVSWAR